MSQEKRPPTIQKVSQLQPFTFLYGMLRTSSTHTFSSMGCISSNLYVNKFYLDWRRSTEQLLSSPNYKIPSSVRACAKREVLGLTGELDLALNAASFCILLKT